VTLEGGGALALFHHRVRDLVKRPPVSAPPDLSAVEAARLLSREGVGSVVVADADGAPVGIVTDRDLRRKVVAEARDPAATPVRAIMSSPLVTLRPGAFAFEAVLEMTRHRIRHVVVVEDGRLVGVVSSRDLLVLHTIHPVTLAREIGRATSLPALTALGARVTDLVRQLVAEGGRPHDIGQLVAELNDRIVVRVLALAGAAIEDAGHGPPPVPYCWLSFGSEARREQTLRTDQDNGLVYADPPAELAGAAAAWYARFADEAIRGLVAVGFPPCPGNVMATNPRWRQPLAGWQAAFRYWIHESDPKDVLAACIHFDLRPLVGALELGAALQALVRAEAPGRRVFLGRLARDVVDRRVPLTLFGHVAVQRRGPHRDTVDVKGAGSIQLVGAGRVHALALGLPETNTIERFRAAGARGLYTDVEVREIGDAAQHLMHVRLAHQLEQLAAGVAPDNYLDPGRLSHADLLLLREALRTVSRVQGGLRDRFATDLLPG
jgi:CBS domain-containing protein